MSAYATAEEFRRIAFQGHSNDDATKFDPLLERASRMFDRMVGVVDGYFDVVGVSATARTIYGDGTVYLKLPPYTSLTSVTMPSGYTVPSYAQKDGYLVVTDSSGVMYDPGANPWAAYSGWLKGVPHTVTAIWGYAAVPPDVKQVVIEIAAKLWRGTDRAWAQAADLNNQELSLSLSEIALAVISQYRMRNAVIA